MCPFQNSRGPLGPAGRVMKYLQRKTKHFLLEADSFCTGGFLSVRPARPGWARMWQEHKDWGESQAECHPSSSRSCERRCKNKHRIHENKSRFWFCLSESGLLDWHPCQPAAGGWAVRLHGPSSYSDALSKHGLPSLGYDCDIIIELISRIPVVYIDMPILPSVPQLYVQFMWLIMSEFIDKKKHCCIWLTSSHLMVESEEHTCLFSHSQSRLELSSTDWDRKATFV